MMTEKAVTPVPCLRSHDLSRFQPTSKGDEVSSNEEILRLLQQMPSLLRLCEDDPSGGSGKLTFRLVIPSDVDPTSANQLESSWFVNIVVTVTDRNGCVIYHEAHFPRNPSLREGIKNFVDVRWSDFVHPPDLEIWNQHLAEEANPNQHLENSLQLNWRTSKPGNARVVMTVREISVAEADRWRAARLAASQSPPPPPASRNSGQRRRRISSGGGSGSSFGGPSQQQQVVSTTSRLSPDIAEAAASAEALLRRFILSPLYRAHWRSTSEVFYFRTISLPFLRNQGGNEGERIRSSSVVNESTSVFSPTSSFENLLLLNYHCILGKVPESSLLEPISSLESTAFDAVTLRVAQKRADFSPLKSATNTTDIFTNSYSPNSSIEHLAKAFCFDNIFSEDGCDFNGEDSKSHSLAAYLFPSKSLLYQLTYLEALETSQESSPTVPEFCQDRYYLFSEQAESRQNSTRPPWYASAHLAPVDIDWIDKTAPGTSKSRTPQAQSQQRSRNSSGMSQITSTAGRGISFVSSDTLMQKDSFVSSEGFKSAETTHSPSCSLPPEVNKTTSQHDKISVFLSLLLPDAIREIKEAVSAEPDMVAQRVRAIVVRHLGPEILSKFFSNSHNHQNSQNQQQTSSSTADFASNTSSYSLPPPPSAASTTTLTNSLICPGRTSSASSETSVCESSIVETSSNGSAKTVGAKVAQQASLLREFATRPASSSSANTQPSKRPSLVQELSVPSESDSLPLPPPPSSALFPPSTNSDLQPFYGPRGRISGTASIRSGQTSCASTPSAIDSLSTGSHWMTTSRTSYQQQTSQQKMTMSSGQIKSTSSILTASQLKAQRQSQPSRNDTSTSSSSPSTQEAHSTAGVLEALLMGNYDRANSRFRRDSGSATSVRQRNISEATAAPSEKPDSCQITSNSGPSSTSCPPMRNSDSNFGFENDEWNNGGNSSSSEAKSGGGNTSAQLIMSPSSTPPCSSLAHLLRHGCPPSNCMSNSVAFASLATPVPTRASRDLASPGLSTACAARVNRLAASPGVPKPLDCPLSIIVDPQSSDTKCDTESVSVCSYEQGHLQSNKPTPPVNRLEGPSPPKQPRLESSLNGISLMSLARKSEIRRSNEEEDLTLANSSLCRLLQGPDPPWESLTAEVDAAAAQASTAVAPPPPPPSFFELSSDALIVGNSDKRARLDSCPSNTRQPLSVPSQPQTGLGGVPSSAKLYSSQIAAPGILNGPRGSSSSAPPSAVNATDLNRSLSPAILERNRRAAAAAAAQIAEEAEHQRRQRPNSHHFYERQRLIFQQNVGQVTIYGQGCHNVPEEALSQQPGPIPQHQQQSQPNLNYSGITNINGMAYNEYDPQQMMSNQRPPLEDFSRQLKEVAPNVRVAPTRYHQNMYPTEQPQQEPTPLTSSYEYSGGHLAPVSYDYQDRSQLCSALAHLPSNHYGPSSQPIYGNSGYATHLPPTQPKMSVANANPQYHNQQQSLFYQNPPRHLQQIQQQQIMYHSQRMPLQPVEMPQSANYPNCYDRQQYSYSQVQHQHQMMVQQHQPTHQAAPMSPLSVVLQQNHPLPPNSQVKASLREKVTSRFQAQGMDLPSIGRPHISPMIGQRRPHPPEVLNSTRGGDKYYYAPPQYQHAVERPNLPLAGDVGSRSENMVLYTSADHQISAQPPVEFQKQVLFQQTLSTEYMSADDMTPKHGFLDDVADNSTSEINADDIDNRANEDIQLTDDLVNDLKPSCDPHKRPQNLRFSPAARIRAHKSDQSQSPLTSAPIPKSFASILNFL
ncbi:hypothetical protein Aperf_G00000079741 [Anoplocephala perfoliata]